MEGVSFAYDLDQAMGLGGRYNPTVLSNVTRDQVYSDIKKFIPPNIISDETLDIIAGAYTQGLVDSRDLLRSAAHMMGDLIFTCPTILFGEQLAKQQSFNGNIYQYRLTYINSKSISYGSQWAEAEHTDEQPLVFGRPISEPLNNWTIGDRNMSEMLIKIWTDFAKYGFVL